MSPISRYAPEPSEQHVTLIERLGGPAAVAEIIKGRLGYLTFTSQAISQWKRRGIPFRYRACLAIEARERGIGVPAGFLGEGEAPPPPTPGKPQPLTAA